MEDLGDVLERADHLEASDLVDSAAGLVVDGAQEFEAPFGVLVDPLDELDGPFSRSDDEQAAGVEPLPAEIVGAHEDDRFLQPDEPCAQAHEQEEELPAHEGQLEEEDEGAEEQEGHDRGLGDGPEDLEVGPRPRRVVHPVRVEGQDPIRDGEDQGQPVAEQGKGRLGEQMIEPEGEKVGQGQDAGVREKDEPAENGLLFLKH
jgi:hypothetical protein